MSGDAVQISEETHAVVAGDERFRWAERFVDVKGKGCMKVRARGRA